MSPAPAPNLRYRRSITTTRNLCAPCNHCARTPVDSERFQTCSGCKLVVYCSRECQKKDWRRHKLECKFIRYDDEQTTKKSRGPFPSSSLSPTEHLAVLRDFLDIHYCSSDKAILEMSRDIRSWHTLDFAKDLVAFWLEYREDNDGNPAKMFRIVDYAIGVRKEFTVLDVWESFDEGDDQGVAGDEQGESSGQLPKKKGRSLPVWLIAGDDTLTTWIKPFNVTPEQLSSLDRRAAEINWFTELRMYTELGATRTWTGEGYAEGSMEKKGKAWEFEKFTYRKNHELTEKEEETVKMLREMMRTDPDVVIEAASLYYGSRKHRFPPGCS